MKPKYKSKESRYREDSSTSDDDGNERPSNSKSAGVRKSGRLEARSSDASSSANSSSRVAAEEEKACRLALIAKYFVAFTDTAGVGVSDTTVECVVRKTSREECGELVQRDNLEAMVCHLSRDHPLLHAEYLTKCGEPQMLTRSKRGSDGQPSASSSSAAPKIEPAENAIRSANESQPKIHRPKGQGRRRNCFEAEAFLNERIGEDGRPELLVKWLGYDKPGDDTWEDKEIKCQEVPEKVAEFEAERRRLNLPYTPITIDDKPSVPVSAPSGSNTSGASTSRGRKPGRPKKKTTPPPVLAKQSANRPGTSNNAQSSTPPADDESDAGEPAEPDHDSSSDHEDIDLEDDEYLPLPAPGRTYRVTQGAVIEQVLALKQMPTSLIAVVKYANEPDLNRMYEIVPTEVIKAHQPAALVAYYEARLRFGT